MNTAARVGRVIGDWNDRRARHDAAAAASLRWRVLDRIAGWLYTRGEQ